MYLGLIAWDVLYSDESGSELVVIRTVTAYSVQGYRG
jgi:hypothetical protein